MNGHPQQEMSAVQAVFLAMSQRNVTIRWTDAAEPPLLCKLLALEGGLLWLQRADNGLFQIAHVRDMKSITQSALDLAREVPARPMVVQ